MSGPSTVDAWIADAKGSVPQLGDVELPDLDGSAIEVAVEACGLCRSDLHLLDGTWGMGEYPMVVGHEVVGRVVAAGPAEAGVEVGQRVGLGWQCGSCLECRECLAGFENLCRRSRLTCVGRAGGLADRIRFDGRFAVPIPEGMTPAAAAPLLCAGASVYAPLKRLVRRGDRVAIIGLGGLGHLAVQYAARAFDCEVHVFSTSADKADDAARFGAAALHDPDPRPHRGSFDLVLSTVDIELPWDRWIRALRPRGTLCLVGIPGSPVSFWAAPLLAGEKSITASTYAGRGDVREALQVAADAGIEPMTVSHAFDGVRGALESLRQGRARYRAVVVR